MRVTVSHLLALLFINLKLGRVIDWSWWWVTAPLWLPVGLLLVFGMFCLFLAAITGQLRR